MTSGKYNGATIRARCLPLAEEWGLKVRREGEMQQVCISKSKGIKRHLLQIMAFLKLLILFLKKNLGLIECKALGTMPAALVIIFPYF